MTIQFGGLATGLDTNTIIEELMALERAPITSLETNKTNLTSKLEAFTELDTKLNAFADGIKDLNFSSSLLQRSGKQSSEEHLTSTVSSDAIDGSSYQLEVVSMAQVQKSVSTTGVTDKTSAGFGTGTFEITVDGTSHSIEITNENNTLEGIAQAINDADKGISAAIINDGTGSPYRLILTGENVAKTFSLDSSGLTGGTDTLGSFNLDDGTGTITNPPVQIATQAHIRVDTIDIYSDSNTLDEAIPGVELDLLKAEVGETTTLNIDVDTSSITTGIEAFVTGYNEVISFITAQSSYGGGEGGVLGGDSGVNMIKRQLQNMLTQQFDNSGTLSSLSQLGLETQRDGTLLVNNATLTDAIDDNLDSVVNLLTGEDGKIGAATQFKDYLFSVTNSTTGMLKGRQDSIDSNMANIDTRIEVMETRLEKRQENLEAQFSAMELLVSSLNTQSSYLTQQMDALTNMYE